MSKDNGLDKALNQHFNKVLDKSLDAGDSLLLEDFVPFRHHLVVERLPPKTTFGGVLVIPETMRVKQALGWVRRVHPYDADEGVFGEGDLVLFADSAGMEVVIGGQHLVILQYHSTEEGDILGHWPAGVFSRSKLTNPST